MSLKPGVSHAIEDSFYVINLGMVVAQLTRWRTAFRITP